MVKMLVMYKIPKDKEAFTNHYFNVHVPLAKKLPGFIKYEVSISPVLSPGSASDIYLIGAVYFENSKVVQEAFASPEGQACAADRKILAPEPDDSLMYLFEIKEV